MENSLFNEGTEKLVSKVSISARLIPALVYSISLLGAALSAFLLMRMMLALSEIKGVGIDVIFASLSESIFPVLGFLYLLIVLGIAVLIMLIVRMVKQTKTASPSSWFFLLSGILCLIPVVTLFEAQSMIIEVLLNQHTADAATVGSNVSLLLILIMVTLPIMFIILVALSLIPLSTIKRPSWGPLIATVFVEVLIIAVTVAFQLRYLWLYKAGL